MASTARAAERALRNRIRPLLALGLALNSFAILYFAIPVGFVAIVGHPFDIFNNFIGDRFLLTSSFMLLTATIITFIFGTTLAFNNNEICRAISNASLLSASGGDSSNSTRQEDDEQAS